VNLELFLIVLINSLFDAAVLALATFGITLIFRTSSTTNFAQGSIASFSVYIAFIISNSIYSTLDPSVVDASAWWVFLVSVAVSLLFGFLLGLIVDVVLIRNAKDITPRGKQMITMGLILVFASLIDIIFGVSPMKMKELSSQNLNVSFSQFVLNIPIHKTVAIVVALIALAVLFIALRNTKWGLGVRATAANETVASMMGINTHLITALSWGLAGALGALAAAFYAPFAGNLNPNLMGSIQVNGFLALILGGASTFYGPVVAAIIIPFLNNYLAVPFTKWSSVLVYAIVLLVVLWKPNGLFGKKVIKKV
jgi:branched-chain amino acid transport system permease protein